MERSELLDMYFLRKGHQEHDGEEPARSAGSRVKLDPIAASTVARLRVGGVLDVYQRESKRGEKRDVQQGKGHNRHFPVLRPSLSFLSLFLIIIILPGESLTPAP